VAKNDHPPCPSAGAPPPGHNKGADPQDRPCKGGKAGHEKDKNDASGGILLVPLALAGSVFGWTRPAGRVGRSRTRLAGRDGSAMTSLRRRRQAR
jgi:hypothetical protein